MPFPTVADEGNSFDDFFDEEKYRLDGSDEENKAHPDQIETLFADAFNQDEYRLPSLDASAAKTDHSPPQPWRKGMWCLKQRQQPPRLAVEKTRRQETKRTEPIQTMNPIYHNFHLAQGPVSPLEISSPSRTKRFITSPAVGGFDPTTYVRPPFSREPTLSPSPMYAQLPISPCAGHGDMSNWQQDFQNFHLRMPFERPLLPQSISNKQNEQSRLARHMNAAIMSRNQGITGQGRGYFDEYSSSHAETGAIDPVLLSPQYETPQDNHQACGADSFLLHDSHATHGLNAMPSPTSTNLPSSGSSTESQSARSHTSNTNLSMHSKAIFSHPTATAHPPLPTLAPAETYPALVAPTPKRVAHPILHQPNDNSLTGLGIQYPELEQMSQAVLYEPQGYIRQAPAPIGVALPYPPATMAPNAMYSYPPLPPPPSNVFPNHSLFTTPRKQRRSPSRSPSPSVSPTNISPRRNPARSPTRSVTDYSQSRRKSIHKSGPIKESTAQDPMPATRTRSSSRPPRTPKAPKTPTGGGAVLDFVNFTPKDSAKLLSDVAPSGSSKTRARREQEAKEKRKKLSEAALKAVKVAGGDVAAFEREIFT
ncbi:uncharacterized protein Z519_11754 [Cladophialophora bantiana CBS 173.52]|uniref:Uncharacterized protein n=1 Tax=Cladophialophora bantiana (strain ATCC 10958 / CBS 173.52 / CDC B-1940 / NIH 8579) TaxID=1442370 RepID=A0A0D2HA44_CLAB1|nr:uncharacterized protein Z519_11754 [Cladophialophora bantiana CBS 173.52]KIW87780.1 hypothetical protein Z519_11754 [Cladophialophora bantiana CBS 173.52]